MPEPQVNNLSSRNHKKTGLGEELIEDYVVTNFDSRAGFQTRCYTLSAEAAKV